MFGKLKAPSKRHFATKVNQRTVAKRLNSVVDHTVDVASDVKMIRLGKAALVKGNFELANGRVYGQHNGTLFPMGGPGVYQLSRGAFKALGVLNQLGTTPIAQEVLDRMGIQEEVLDQAMKIYRSIKHGQI